MPRRSISSALAATSLTCLVVGLAGCPDPLQERVPDRTPTSYSTSSSTSSRPSEACKAALEISKTCYESSGSLSSCNGLEDALLASLRQKNVPSAYASFAAKSCTSGCEARMAGMSLSTYQRTLLNACRESGL